MSEGRRTRVALLDGRGLDILVQPRLEVGELLAIVASHVGIRAPDTDLLGLAFADESGRHHWLHPDRRVLDHDFPRKLLAPSATLLLFHMVKFYPESILQLHQARTVELFFLQTKAFISRGCLSLPEESIAKLAALQLQMALGHYSDVGDAVSAVPLALQAFGSHQLLPTEEATIEEYKKLEGLSKGDAMLKYMGLVEAVGTYGMHFYPVKDKSGVPWSLGISARGIFQFEAAQAPQKPRRVPIFFAYSPPTSSVFAS